MIDRPPKPISSPMPALDDVSDHDTGDFEPVVASIVKKKRKKWQAEQKHLDFVGRLKTWAGVFTGFAAAVVIGYTRFVSAAEDAGTKAADGIQQQVAQQRTDFDRFQKVTDGSIERLEKKTDRLETKIDLLLDAARVPERKRPKADGGDP